MYKECSPRNLLLTYYTKEPFISSHWPIPTWIFVSYRLIVASYTIVWLLYTATQSDGFSEYPWPVWLTNWTYLMLTVHLTVAALNTVMHNIERCSCNESRNAENEPLLRRQDANSDDTEYTEYTPAGPSSVEASSYTDPDFELSPPRECIPWYLRFSWVTYNIISSFAVIVTFIYFVMLYPQDNSGLDVSIEDINLHGINSVLVALEVILAGYPVKMLHFIYPILYGIVYVIFSVIYWSYDHSRVWYPKVLDWNDPGNTMLLICVTGFVGLPMLHLLHFGFYQLKCHLHNASARFSNIF